MRKIKSFKVFNSVESRLRVFESDVTSIEESLSIVKEMLKELDFLDISSNAVIRRSDGVLFIRITIWKPIDQGTLPKPWMNVQNFINMEKSFSQDDISNVVMTIKDYLLSEGFQIDDERELYNCGIWGGSSYINLRTQYQIRFKK